MSNNTGNKLFVMELIPKKDKRGSESVKIENKPTIATYQDKDGAWHCDIDINGYKYGALRHDKQEIETFAEMQIRFISNKGINLIRK